MKRELVKQNKQKWYMVSTNQKVASKYRERYRIENQIISFLVIDRILVLSIEFTRGTLAFNWIAELGAVLLVLSLCVIRRKLYVAS